MKTVPSHKVETALRWLLALLMLWAAISKLANPTDFLGSIYGYELSLPRLVLQTAAVVLPWVELLCGLLLLAGYWSQTALLFVTGLLALFVIATGQAWARGLDISCGCFNLQIFGLPERLPDLVRFLESVAFAFCRNLLLVGLAGFLLRRELRSLQAVRAIRSE